jgi:hypothetical protein
MLKLPKPAWQVLNLILLLVTIITNGLANGGLVAGKTVGSISNQYATLFAPAGITFSIWGVIYLLLIAFAIYQARDLFSKTKQADPWLLDIGPWFALSCLFNVGWLFAWLNEHLGLSLLMMMGLLGSLTIIYLSLHIGQKVVSPQVRYLVHLPFSVYLAWINVATVANVSALLVQEGWSGGGLGPLPWTIFMVVAAAAIGVFVTGSRNDIAFGAVIVWALIGIIIKQNQLGGEAAQPIQLAAGVGIGMVILTGVMTTIRRPRPGYV